MKLFTHYRNGKIYQLLEGAVVEGATWAGDSEDIGPVVVYKCIESDTLYYRPKREFFGSVYSPDRRVHVTRFTEVARGEDH